MRGWGSTTDRILHLLAEYDELTRAEICEHLSMDRQYVSAIVSRLNRKTPTLPKRIYIVRYVHDAIGSRRYPRAVYALGDKPDARKPKSDVRAIKRRYEANLKRRLSGSSVFNLAMSRQQIHAMRKELNERTE